jgi:hypothetical protein
MVIRVEQGKGGEFIRRFLIHVLPGGFHRIRHYGLFASSKRAENITRARELLVVPTPQSGAAAAPADSIEPQKTSHPCPCCGGRMIIIEIFERGCSAHTRPTSLIRIDTHDDHHRITASQCASSLPLLDRTQRRLPGSAIRASMARAVVDRRIAVWP